MKYLLFVFQFIVITAFPQTPVSFQELGLSFELPEGWNGQIQEEYYLVGHETMPGLMILFKNSATSAADLKASAQQGIYDEGVQLKPSSDFELKGSNKIEGFYEGIFDGAQVKCFGAGIINSKGSGITILMITTKDQFTDRHISEAKKLASSVEFYEATESEETVTWENNLVGNQLRYMHTSTSNDYSGGMSGTSDDVIIKLYAGGNFYYYSNSNSSFSAQSGFGYADATDSNEGKYKIYSIGGDSYLELTFVDGKIYEYALSKSVEGETYLNGERYFVLDIEE